MLHFIDQKTIIVTSLLLFAFGVVSCDDDSSNQLSDTGTLEVQITDDPFPAGQVSSANVTIDSVQIRRAEGENDDNNGNPFTTISREQQSFNLLELTNDVVDQLVNTEIEAGVYDQIRLFIAESSITLENGDSFDLKVPSGAQSGLKINVGPAIEVTGGLTSELLLDFNVAKSFVARGRIGTPGFNGFIFKPVVRAVNISTSGRIAGDVTMPDSTGQDVAAPNTEVWVTLSDTVFSSTISNQNGSYALIGLPVGIYNLWATKPDQDTAFVEGVEVVEGNLTEQNIQLPSSN